MSQIWNVGFSLDLHAKTTVSNTSYYLQIAEMILLYNILGYDSFLYLFLSIHSNIHPYIVVISCVNQHHTSYTLKPLNTADRMMAPLICHKKNHSDFNLFRPAHNKTTLGNHYSLLLLLGMLSKLMSRAMQSCYH